MRRGSMGRAGALVLALAAVLTFMVDMADARVGRGGGFGSRGSRTFTAPPSTSTAPTKVKPVEKSITQPGTPTSGVTSPRPGMATTPVASRFGSGFGGMLLGGLLGAGLFGLLSGAGLFGGMTGFASFLGLLLQGALIAGVIYLLMAYFRGRQQPAHAFGQSGQPGAGAPMARSALGGLGGLGGGLSGAGAASALEPELAISQADYDAFERLLSEIQGAYSREDVDALGDMVTPEMLSYFSRDLADYKRKGVRNEVTDVKLLQGDLAESWREPGTDYATVAMRFSLRDALVDRTTGQPVGGAAEPEEATEVWTFRRDHNQTLSAWQQGWQLSAIQQVE